MRLRVHARKTDYIGMLLMIPFLKPGAVETMFPQLDRAFDISRVGAFLLLFCMFAYKKFRIDKVLIVTVLWSACVMISTVMNHGVVWKACLAIANPLAAYFFTNIFIKKNKMRFSYLCAPLIVLLFINILTWIAYPEGLYTQLTSLGTLYSTHTWLLGGKNGYFNLVFFALVVHQMERDERKIGKKRIRMMDLFLYILVVWNMLAISDSSTGIVGTILMLCYLFIEQTPIVKDKKYALIYLLGAVAAYMIVVFVRQPWILETISRLLGKDVTMTGRTIVWDKTLMHVLDKPLFGHGILDAQTAISLIAQTTAHNKILNVLFENGFVGLTVFAGILFLAVRSIIENYQEVIAPAMGWAFFVLMIVWMTEVYYASFLISMFLFMCCYIPDIARRQNR